MKEKGSILLALLFIILISVMGLTLMTHSVTHLHIIKARNEKEKNIDILYNQLFVYLHNIREKIEKTDFSNIGNIFTDLFNKKNFPDKTSGSIRLSNKFTFLSQKKEFYEKIRGDLFIRADYLRKNSHFSNGNKFTIYSGEIPIQIVPFLLTKKTIPDPEKYMKKYSIDLKDHLINRTPVSSRIILDFTRFFSDNYSGDNLKPVGDLIKNGPDLESKDLTAMILFYFDKFNRRSMLVNTNIDKLIFSIDGDIQIIEITKGNQLFIIEYIPGDNYINTSDPEREFNHIFSEKIVVNGNIELIEQSGEYAFTPKTGLDLIAFGKIFIDGSLKTKNGIRKNIAPLTLVSAINPFDIKNKTQKSITISGGYGHLDISIITSGKLINLNRISEIGGSLACNNIENSGKINIYSQYKPGTGNWFRLTDFTLLSEFFTDYIEEAFDE